MAETKNVKELWQGALGCGCLSIIIGCFFPPMWPFLIIGTIIAVIYAIVKSPYIFFRNRKRAIEDKVIVECKATEKNNPIFAAQVNTCLHLLNKRLGIVINFGQKRILDGWECVANHMPT